MNALLEALSVLWCRAHHSITRPQGAYYRCQQCGRQYAVPWARESELPAGCYVREQ